MSDRIGTDGKPVLPPLMFNESKVRGVELEAGGGLGLAKAAPLPHATSARERHAGSGLVSVLDKFEPVGTISSSGSVSARAAGSTFRSRIPARRTVKVAEVRGNKSFNLNRAVEIQKENGRLLQRLYEIQNRGSHPAPAPCSARGTLASIPGMASSGPRQPWQRKRGESGTSSRSTARTSESHYSGRGAGASKRPWASPIKGAGAAAVTKGHPAPPSGPSPHVSGARFRGAGRIKHRARRPSARMTQQAMRHRAIEEENVRLYMRIHSVKTSIPEPVAAPSPEGGFQGGPASMPPSAPSAGGHHGHASMLGTNRKQGALHPDERVSGTKPHHARGGSTAGPRAANRRHRVAQQWRSSRGSGMDAKTSTSSRTIKASPVAVNLQSRSPRVLAMGRYEGKGKGTEDEHGGSAGGASKQVPREAAPGPSSDDDDPLDALRRLRQIPIPGTAIGKGAGSGAAAGGTSPSRIPLPGHFYRASPRAVVDNRSAASTNSASKAEPRQAGGIPIAGRRAGKRPSLIPAGYQRAPVAVSIGADTSQLRKSLEGRKPLAGAGVRLFSPMGDVASSAAKKNAGRQRRGFGLEHATVSGGVAAAGTGGGLPSKDAPSGMDALDKLITYKANEIAGIS